MNKPIKILFFTTGLNTGGAEMMLYKLLSRINRNKFTPMILSLKPGNELQKKIEQLDVPVHVFNITHWSSWKRAVDLLKSEKPDIIQGWMYHGNFFSFFMKLLACPKANLLFGVRHTPSQVKRNKFLTQCIISMGAFLSKYTKGIIYASNESANYHSSVGYDARKKIVISNGFDADLFKPSMDSKERLKQLLKLQDDALTIGYVARYHPIKGYDVFLEAAGNLKKKGYPNIHFVCIGRDVNWENRFFLKSLDKYGLSKDNLHLLGERDNVQDLMPGFDIFSLSSYSEGFPNVLGEAMSCSLPSVATNVSDCSLIVGDAGFIVPPGNPQALAKAWEHILSLSPKNRAELGAKARKRVQENYSLNHIIKTYEDTYENVYYGTKIG